MIPQGSLGPVDDWPSDLARIETSITLSVNSTLCLIAFCPPKPTFAALVAETLYTFRAPGALAREVLTAAKDLAVEKAMVEAQGLADRGRWEYNTHELRSTSSTGPIRASRGVRPWRQRIQLQHDHPLSLRLNQ
jgi:hypothetical protein